jgi:hypothetical protein
MTDTTLVLSSDDTTAAALVSTIQSATNGVGKYAAYVEAHSVTSENVKDHAFALAVLAYPTLSTTQKKDGKRTKFGNAVQAAGAGLRGALSKDSDDDTETREVKYLTAAGAKVESLSDVLAKVEAEWTAAHSTEQAA